VKTQSSNKNRSFAWEDEAPEESLVRHVQKGVPPAGHSLPDIPLEMEEPEGDELPPKGKPRFGGGRFDGPKRPWWRPASKLGRVFLTLAALVMLGGLATCTSLLIAFLNSDARFRISGANNIEATGLTEVSRAEMLPVFGEDIGRNIFFVPLGERRRQLEELPWVEKATVMRLLPNQIRVSIVERQPVAFVRQGAQIGLVDASGVLLTMPAAMMAQRHYSFPVVTGINAQDPLSQRKARMEVYQRLLPELDASGQKLSAQISDIDLSDPADARVTLEDDPGTLLHFGQEKFLERYQRYKAGIGEWRQQHPDLLAVDLRYDTIAVLSMPPGSNAAQGADNDQNAENGQIIGEQPEKNTSGGNAPKANVKPAGNGAGKVKATAKKDANAKARTVPTPVKAKRPVKAKAKDRKRAEIQRAAQNINRRKNAPATRPASSAGQGQ
jgi:cell division protein FtsQ